jgi:hypothetical protein
MLIMKAEFEQTLESVCQTVRRLCQNARDPALILVEAAPGFTAQPACINHFDQKRARPVFGIA